MSGSKRRMQLYMARRRGAPEPALPVDMYYEPVIERREEEEPSTAQVQIELANGETYTVGSIKYRAEWVQDSVNIVLAQETSRIHLGTEELCNIILGEYPAPRHMAVTIVEVYLLFPQMDGVMFPRGAISIHKGHHVIVLSGDAFTIMLGENKGILATVS